MRVLTKVNGQHIERLYFRIPEARLDISEPWSEQSIPIGRFIIENASEEVSVRVRFIPCRALPCGFRALRAEVIAGRG